jgi:lipopolysaccharide/colanic/teichoic acid biosynthesis glycosyltransferase
VTAKRAFDVLVAAAGVVVALPVMAIAALAIKLDTPGPVLFRQERVGRAGKIFRIHKFRTMVADAAASGVDLTIGDDRRITRVGRLLRPSRLDELPQLFDVLAGNMSLVGPRPELPRYVAKYPADLRDKVLAVRPGITDPASIEFADESLLLGRAPDPEREYVEVILPRKLAAAASYADRATLLTDLKVIAQS